MAELAAFLSYDEGPLRQLICDAPNLYTSFEIPKADGTKRRIQPPAKPLRILQRSILDKLQLRVRYPRWMTGGVPKRSIFDHARPHVGKTVVATFDVHSFFPSTNTEMVCRVLGNLGFRGEALGSVLRLVVKSNELPQGGPTSQFLANLSLEPTDRRIDALCRKHRVSYTRYVDDMALSGQVDLRSFKGLMVDWIEESGYAVAPGKIKFMGRGEAQIVTKLCVNEKLRPTGGFISEVKVTIRECLAVGAYRVAAATGMPVSQLKNSLTGKVSHIACADRDTGGKLRGMLSGVDWTSVKEFDAGESAS